MHTTTTRARFARLVAPLVFLSAATAGCDIAMAHLNEKETATWHRTYELQPGGRGGDVHREINHRRGGCVYGDGHDGLSDDHRYSQRDLYRWRSHGSAISRGCVAPVCACGWEHPLHRHGDLEGCER